MERGMFNTVMQWPNWRDCFISIHDFFK